MSTLRVNNLQSTSTTDGGISIDTSGHVTIDGQVLPSAGPLSNRNLIINGAMQVAQRGTSVTSVTSTGYRTCDRFRVGLSNLGTWTATQSTDAPSGFSNSYKLECTTADASPAAADFMTLQYRMEGQDLQLIKKGISAAESLVVSFWIKSSKTGTHIFDMYDVDNSRGISKSYTVNSADTWEYKTITIEGDTTGTLDNDNALSFQLGWWFGAGSNYSGGTLNTTWGTLVSANRAVGQVNLADTVGNTWQITGVQLEVGSVATPFEHRSYGDELARCQRYYEKMQAQLFNYENYFDNNGYGAHTSRVFAANKRAAPTITVPTPQSTSRVNGSVSGFGRVEGVTIYASSSAGGAFWYLFNSTDYVEASAEL